MSIYTAIARTAIAREIGLAPPALRLDDDSLLSPGAAFVTLTIDGRLRGCIGSLAARQPLRRDIEDNAIRAAFADPRFPPLSAAEFDAIAVEVSVLSAPVPLAVSSRSDAEGVLRPGIDGVVLTAGAHRATFLPQVWEALPDPRVFLDHLLAKAGLAPSTWPEGVRLETYTVTAHHE